MKRAGTVLTFLFSIALACTPFPVHSALELTSQTSLRLASGSRTSAATFEPDPVTGILDPATIEYRAVPSGPTIYHVGRTDVAPNVTSEAWLPTGAPGNSRSAECDGGYFLVGPNGEADFSSEAGTISLWIKWDGTAPHGRFWGQDFDFETRWSAGRITLDWGSDTTLQGYKTDWIVNHWYYIAITWNETSNRLAVFWGDESNLPTVDIETDSWFQSLSGLHTENNIMNSAGRSNAQVIGHVDDFRYYDRDCELDTLRSGYRIALASADEHLVHYFEFEEDLTDSVGQADLEASGPFDYSLDVFSGEGGWRASEVTVDVRALERLAALNGTFESGVPGTNVDWSGDGEYYPYGWRAQREILFTQGRQRAGFIDTETGYVAIENQGYEVSDPDGFRHYNGTRIFWFQTVNNSGLFEEFSFEFSYQYLHGPIGTNFSNIFEFSAEILNGSDVLWAWSMDPTNLTERGTWFDTGPLALNLTNAPSSFEFRIGLKVDTSGEYIEIPVDDADLGGDSTNGQFISFMIDDVRLAVEEPMSCESAELVAFNIMAGQAPVIGSQGAGNANLSFSSWDLVAIPVEISSNISVSFEVSVQVSKMTRFENSTSSTNADAQGISYSAHIDEDVETSLFTYVESYVEATELALFVVYPVDWQPVAVRNPVGGDVTVGCSFGLGTIEVPSGVAGMVGWWRFELLAPNYASNVQTEMRQETASSWVESDLFGNGDGIRCIAGSESGFGHEAIFDFYLPSGSIWATSTGQIGNTTVESDPFILGPVNASVGVWMCTFCWNNGTEVAYGSTQFEVHHMTSIFPQTPSFRGATGDVFTAAIYIYDQDNGNPILADAEVIGNLSTETIVFHPNLARNWWEVTLNTSMLTAGQYSVQVNVSIPFYETTPCFIILDIPPTGSGFAVAFVAGVGVALAIFLGLLSMTYGRRLHMSMAAKRNAQLLEMKGRLDDAKNLIGLLVIQKTVGLSLYSKVIKGAFEESILSSFISAISHFRSEFSMTEPKWKSIPITEAITAVQTEQLICAIITVDPASERTRERLESFSRSIGDLYDPDDELSTPGAFKSENLEELALVVDPFFEGYFDGGLLTRYVGLRKSIPGRLRPVTEAFQSMEIDHGVSPQKIIRSAVLLGYSERRAYASVLEAVDEGYLIRAKDPIALPTED